MKYYLWLPGLFSFFLLLANSILLSGQDHPPTAYCQTGIITVPLPSSGCITIYAKDLDRGSSDDVTPLDKLKFYFNGDPGKVSITICCEDFQQAGVIEEFMLNSSMYVEDELHQTDSCKTTIIIQDILSICPSDPAIPVLRGNISCINGACLEATIDLFGPNNYHKSINSCSFEFNDLIHQGDYSLCIEKNDYHVNGVSTADIVRIRKHILGIESLNNPYYFIAADVNHSSSITAADISEIKKLILGFINEFSKVPSWVFVSTDSIKSITSPFIKNSGLCRQFYITDTSFLKLNYVGIKMGDVNGTAKCSNFRSILPRSGKVCHMNYKNIKDHNLIQTIFYLNDKTDINGLQFTIQFDPTLCELVEIKSGQLILQEDHVSLLDLIQGKIHIVWDKNPLDLKLNNSEDLFSIIWKAKTSENEFPKLQFNPNGIEPLLIDPYLNEVALELSESNEKELSGIDAFYNSNSGSIQLNGTLQKNDCIHYSLFDITGKLLYHSTKNENTGIFSEFIPVTDFNSYGICFLKVYSKNLQKYFKILIE